MRTGELASSPGSNPGRRFDHAPHRVLRPAGLEPDEAAVADDEGRHARAAHAERGHVLHESPPPARISLHLDPVHAEPRIFRSEAVHERLGLLTVRTLDAPVEDQRDPGEARVRRSVSACAGPCITPSTQSAKASTARASRDRPTSFLLRASRSAVDQSHHRRGPLHRHGYTRGLDHLCTAHRTRRSLLENNTRAIGAARTMIILRTRTPPAVLAAATMRRSGFPQEAIAHDDAGRIDAARVAL